MTMTVTSLANRLHKLEQASDESDRLYIAFKLGDGSIVLTGDGGKNTPLSADEYRELSDRCDRTGATLVVLNWQV